MPRHRRTRLLLALAIAAPAAACSTTTASTSPARAVTSTTPDVTAPTSLGDHAVSAPPAPGPPTSPPPSAPDGERDVGSGVPVPGGPAPVTLAFVGDVLPHSPLWRRAERNAADRGRVGYDFDPMLAELAPVVAAADLAVCHLETPIAPLGEELSTMPRYGVPAEIVDALAGAGFDRCSTASNHTADRGPAGIDRTVDVLESRGLGQSGMARERAEIRPRVFDVGGIAVSHLSYTWSYNGLSLPEGEEWRSALIDVDRIVADARVARSIGADAVIVSLHWGTEGVHAPTGYQREVADRITASGSIDLVVGHHAHVLQPIERVNGVWVLFGLGNILSNLPTSSRWPDASQDGVVVTVEISPAGDGAVEVGRPVAHPTWVDKEAGWIVRLVDRELARDGLPTGHRDRLERSLTRTREVLGAFVPAPAG